MFLFCTDTLAVMANLRCGHTNMYHYFRIAPYCITEYTIDNWKEHHNPVVVLRNPLERVKSSIPFSKSLSNTFYILHSRPYMHNLLECNFRIIDFYDLEQYIPRSKLSQSPRTNTRIDDNIVVEDVHVPNDVYSLEDLREELKIYKEFMRTKERISVQEWKELTE